MPEQVEQLQPSPSESDSDASFLLSEALANYLEEVHAYRSICLRHENTTLVAVTRRALRLTRSLLWTQSTVESVRASAVQLPSWETSPFWKASSDIWIELERKMTGARGHLAFTRGISWQGRPILVCMTASRPESPLNVELLLPHLDSDLPELPVRTAAHGLLCHEYLLPDSAAQLFSCRREADRRSLTLRQYLTRAMPQNLYASYCLPLGRAEK